jgi:hypothetical protein
MNKYYAISNIGMGHLDLYCTSHKDGALVGENVMVCLCTTYVSRPGTINIMSIHRSRLGGDYGT